MERRIVIGSVLSLFCLVLLCSIGCDKLNMKLGPEIDYELLADMVAERVDERMEAREIQKGREQRGAARPESAWETVPDKATPEEVSETIGEALEKTEQPVKEELEVQVEVPDVTIQREPETPPVEVPPRAPPKEKAIEINGIDFVLVEVPAGEFRMGCSTGAGLEHEYPQHKVAITRPFYLGKYEVTQSQWIKVMGSNPSYFKSSGLPVENISWNDVQSFITKLNAMTGQKFRLATEAEWEYACRAGSDAQYCFGDDENKLDEYAWYSNNSESRTHPVGQKKPNEFGLYDILGNVWEWCADRYSNTYYSVSPKNDPKGPASGKDRILRGGCWSSSTIGIRSANRYYKTPTHKYADTGFRIAQDAP